MVVVAPGLVVLGVVGVVVPFAGVVPEGVVVVDELGEVVVVDGLGEMVLGAPVTDDGVVPIVVPLVPVLGTQLLDVEVVAPMVPVEELVPVDVVVLGEAVVPAVVAALPVPGVHG